MPSILKPDRNQKVAENTKGSSIAVGLFSCLEVRRAERKKPKYRQMTKNRHYD
jgi:hypothetical protein